MNPPDDWNADEYEELFDRHSHTDGSHGKDLKGKPTGQKPNHLRLAGPEGAPDDPDEWQRGLRKNDKGILTKDPGNAALILANDPRWSGLRYDQFKWCEVWENVPPVYGMHVPDDPDGFALYVGHWLAKFERQTFTKEAVGAAIMFAARKRQFHRVQDYLEPLAWDGTPRISTWLTTYLGAEDTPTNQAMGRMWLISAVARAYKPGSKVDHMLVLEGAQGAKKTTALEALCSAEWFQPELGDLKHKDAISALKGKWLVCMDELHSLRSSDVTELAKNYLTRTVDKYRPAYGRHDIDQPRGCVFAGTTNADTYLSDPTGNRRFWPVRVQECRPDLIRQDRDQLWAEAKEAYLSGEQWWPTKEHQALFSKATDERTQTDEWLPLIASDIQGRDWTTVTLCLEKLGFEQKDFKQSEQNRVSKILRVLGWERFRLRKGEHLFWAYRPKGQE